MYDLPYKWYGICFHNPCGRDHKHHHELPVTVVVPAGEGGLRQRSMVNTAQLLTIDKARLQKRLGRLSQIVIQKVNAAIRASLDV